ncbi:hypothetical protein J8V57_17735 [Xenorhabdus sp. PB61.4]|uniref:hypothetical protein n=1 Tax=Xenorhabdus sp. PB61.4 TaxID=2788940 RepID=UPI001E568C60|nr:hypothetical protein [Xenorhabdus sp. PB61.4]MCC8368078.1 hypothetical protein [Xenorhabdus sp. PB61.4]
MKKFIFLFIILFSSSSFSNKEELNFKDWENKGSWGIYNEKPDSYFNPLKIKDYKEGYLPSFSYLINKFGFNSVNNTYCVIGYKWNKKEDDEEFTRVIVFWKNANYLIDWDLPDGDTEHRYKAIIFSKPFIDMKDSVVPYKEAEGAQALWAKEGVIQLLEDCELHGQKITIKPSEVVDIK